MLRHNGLVSRLVTIADCTHQFFISHYAFA
jgi:hypothetical protein